MAALLGAVQLPRYRTALTLIYHTGLRVGEAVRIQVRDTHTPHPRLRVRCGKGGKDRYVPLAPAMVAALRAWWQTHRHPTFLFPGPTSGWRERAQPAAAAQRAPTHLSVSAVQNTFRLARATAGLPVEATVHTLRHCYANRTPCGLNYWYGLVVLAGNTHTVLNLMGVLLLCAGGTALGAWVGFLYATYGDVEVERFKVTLGLVNEFLGGAAINGLGGAMLYSLL